MNSQKYTQKSLEVLQNAQSLAVENQNAQIEQEHLLLALLGGDESLIKELFKKMGISNDFEIELNRKVGNMPKITGGARRADSIYVSQEDDFGQIWKKNLDEVIDELCSVRDEINRLKNEYDNDEFLKFMDKNFEYDVPIHDYQTQRKDSIGE